MSAILQRKSLIEPDAYRLEGGELINWGKGAAHKNSVFAAFAAAMEILEEPQISYDYLEGVSAHAFRLQIFDREPHGTSSSSAHPMYGFNCAELAYDAMPFVFEHFEADPANPVSQEEINKKIVAYLDEGLPTVAFFFETDLITGYRKGDKHLLARCYRFGGKGLHEPTDPYSSFSTPVDIREVGERVVAVRNGILLGLRNASTDRFEGYRSGFAAYEEWRTRLQDETWIASASTEEVEAFQSANATLMESLADARRSARRFLRHESGLFEWHVAPHMHAAADIYDDMVRSLVLPSVDAISPYPGIPWTTEIRQLQIQRLHEAEEFEKKAFGELEKFLEMV